MFCSILSAFYVYAYFVIYGLFTSYYYKLNVINTNNSVFKMRASTRILSQRALHGNINNNPIRETSKQFKIELNMNSFGTVTYEKENDIYDLVHSSIPEDYQGKGLGNILATRVFDHLVEKNQKFKITCEFLQKVFQEHKDKYEKFVVQ